MQTLSRLFLHFVPFIYIFHFDATFRFRIPKQSMRTMIYVDIVETGICSMYKIFARLFVARRECAFISFKMRKSQYRTVIS